MRIFLAGATGVIGRALAPMLVADGCTVVGTTRSAGKAELLRSFGARPAVVDALDRDALHAAVREARPDAVIHQLTDLSAWDHAANARLRREGTRNLVDAARAVGVRRVVAQSIAFAQVPGDGPAREDEPLAERYRSSVGVLEETVLEAAEGVVLRYGILYGPGTTLTSDGLRAEEARRGDLVATDNITSFIHTTDAARAAVVALGWPTGIVNIVDDEPAPGVEWAPIFARLIGAPPPPVRHERDPAARGASNAKARDTLGWTPLYPTWREGFRTALG